MSNDQQIIYNSFVINKLHSSLERTHLGLTREVGKLLDVSDTQESLFWMGWHAACADLGLDTADLLSVRGGPLFHRGWLASKMKEQLEIIISQINAKFDIIVNINSKDLKLLSSSQRTPFKVMQFLAQNYHNVYRQVHQLRDELQIEALDVMDTELGNVDGMITSHELDQFLATKRKH